MSFANGGTLVRNEISAPKTQYVEVSADDIIYGDSVPVEENIKITQLKTITKTTSGKRYVTAVIKFDSAKRYKIVFSGNGVSHAGNLQVSLDNRPGSPSSVKSLGSFSLQGLGESFEESVDLQLTKSGQYYIGFYTPEGVCPQITDIKVIGMAKGADELQSFPPTDIAGFNEPPVQNVNTPESANVETCETDNSLSDDLVNLPNIVKRDEAVAVRPEKTRSTRRRSSKVRDKALPQDETKVKAVVGKNTEVPRDDNAVPNPVLQEELTAAPEQSLVEEDSIAEKTDSVTAAADTLDSASSVIYDDEPVEKDGNFSFPWYIIPFILLIIALLWLLDRCKHMLNSRKNRIEDLEYQIKATRQRIEVNEMNSAALSEQQALEEVEKSQLSEAEKVQWNRQLGTYAASLAGLNEFNQKVATQLHDIMDDAATTSARRKVLVAASNAFNKFADKVVHEDFETAFAAVHEGFFERLASQYPNLSKSDLALSAYLYLGVSTKEIASLTNKEIRSVESSRNRLRKKLNLESGQDFVSFFASI